MKFINKIFSTTFLLFSLFLLTYTFYKSEIFWNGEKSDYYFTYYIFSIILIITSIITFFLNQKIKEYLIISLISIMFGLYFFESYLVLNKEFTNHQLDKMKIYQKEKDKKYDTRSPYQIYNDLKKIDENITVSVSPNNYFNKNINIFPLSGISNSKTIHCNENGHYSIYESDRYGFNNPDIEWDKKDIEYLLVGDSFTHGACVNRPYDIASVLRLVSNKSVLNLGYSANGPLMYYATLREYLDTNVKNILWIFYEGNDLLDLQNELKVQILKNYLQDLSFAQNLKFRQNEINNLSKKLIEEKKKISIYNYRNFLKLDKTRTKLNYLLPKKFKPKNDLQEYSQKIPEIEFRKILELTKNLTIKNNSNLYFVYLPEYMHYKPDYKNTNYILVKKIVEELKIPFIDIHKEVFTNSENPLNFFPFGLNGHYNINGYKKVAESIYINTLK
tara:strand:- start:83 stop:1417 length:1335 start_codon:yes stop_codon:yes gene_type:complete